MTIEQRCLICVWTVADVYRDEPAGITTLAAAGDTCLEYRLSYIYFAL